MITPDILAAALGGIILATVVTYIVVSRAEKKDAGARNEHLNNQFLTVQRQLSELQVVKASLSERLHSRELKIAELENQLTSANQALEDERARLVHTRQEISRLETTLTEQKQQAAEKLELIKEAKVSMQDGFKNLANEIFESKQKEFKEQSREHLSGVLDPLQEKIKSFEKRVEQTYTNEAKERFSLVKELKSLQDLNSRIAQDAVNLTNALKGENKTQGIWGEVVLEKVLEKSGLEKGREYETQVSLKNSDGKRMQPDAIVRLPEDKDVVVDSKVSLTAYERFCSSEDEAERAEALKLHIASLRQHIRQLSDKDYQALEGIRTLDFVLLFVPIEAAFSVAVTEDAELFSDAFSRNIVIVAPSTLLATLRTIQNIWRYEQQNKNAQEIATRAGALYDKFVNFVGDLELIGSRLDSTQNAYQDAFNKLASGKGNLVKRAEDMKALGAKVSKSLPQNLVEMPQRDGARAISSAES
ncbi:MAG: DNA recombination protein RmuC [Pseudomonadales bacterium]|nr:DNA recombination protein RmuC [Pseudomonadales bacterium]MBO6566804.1 DNA recombination protein RmuC [Pseudomonadales bacterium]MBO6594392.1 DNA recombination protein RmuC [Pseudomonadales bacterium]MBO6655568.1 DNA recombination protein RmuC [Pseudomonadales bacterium]MBO6822047.1 DNA recombination protein RmuC [Pseudomonadales bacterium]